MTDLRDKDDSKMFHTEGSPQFVPVQYKKTSGTNFGSKFKAQIPQKPIIEIQEPLIERTLSPFELWLRAPLADDSAPVAKKKAEITDYLNDRWVENQCPYCLAPHGRKRCPLRKEMRAWFGKHPAYGVVCADYETILMKKTVEDEEAVRRAQKRQAKMQKHHSQPALKRQKTCH